MKLRDTNVFIYAQGGPHPYREPCRAVLARAHERLSPRDAIHAAVVLTNGLEGIVSADRAFDGVPGLVRFDPADLAREGG